MNLSATEQIVSFLRTEPARRHKCEVCNRVFICELCTIRKEHQLHVIRDVMDPETPMLICPTCAVRDGYNFRVSSRSCFEYATGRKRKIKVMGKLKPIYWVRTWGK